MKGNSGLYLRDILNAIDAIEKFVGEMSFSEFKNDDKTSSAVIKKFEIIGEASKNIPDEIKQKHQEVPWKDIAAMRDKLIHFYFGTKYELVWDTIKIDIPRLKPLIQKILQNLEID